MNKLHNRLQQRFVTVGDSDQSKNSIGVSDLSIVTEECQVPHVSVSEIFDACRNGNIVLVRRLLETGVDINLGDKSGRNSTPLHFAAGYGRQDVVSLLLDNNANVSERDEGGTLIGCV